MRKKEIIEKLQAIESRLELVLNWLSFISHKEAKIMSTLADLEQAIADAAAASASEKAEVQAALAAQATKIQELLDQIAGGVVPGALVTQDQLDALVVAVSAVSAATADIYTPV